MHTRRVRVFAIGGPHGVAHTSASVGLPCRTGAGRRGWEAPSAGPCYWNHVLTVAWASCPVVAFTRPASGRAEGSGLGGLKDVQRLSGPHGAESG